MNAKDPKPTDTSHYGKPPDTGHKFTYQQMVSEVDWEAIKRVPGHVAQETAGLLDDDIPRLELIDQARQPCHCSGFRCAAHLAQDELRRNKPKTVAVIAMPHLVAELNEAYHKETYEGRVVLGMFDGQRGGESIHGFSPYDAVEMMKMRIDLADEVLVLNFCGQVGDHVAKGIEYAELSGKPIRWLEPPAELCKVCNEPIERGDVMGVFSTMGVVWEGGFAHGECATRTTTRDRKVDP